MDALTAGFAQALGIAGVVLCGSVLQRVSGMGFGLLVGSVLSIMLGPIEGVLIVNIFALATSIVTTHSMRAHIDYQRLKFIAPFLLVGSIPGMYLIARTGTGILQIIVGSVLLFSLALVVVGKKFLPPIRRMAPAAVAGAVAGFTSMIIGAGGPAITVYAHGSKWEHRSFSSTLQPILLLAATISISIKLVVLGFAPVQQTAVSVWVLGTVGMCAGTWIGTRLAGKISRDKARSFTLLIATLGGISALIRGFAAL
ncbi:MAG: sulfite exporter TauE/SafE family protein [Corynebacterium sp.]|uniref:sulfite exporter TauE/SafE family protein n=1 Tax=Corynebacterium sp. TaxID=1720 RepID=UPI0026DC98B3|nr:sulfite exporter TauE/SafE family protein [Corynebacterium sp.]MDO4762351.1 sulfite exporter TauE/SafE family protein [Corynebacterium sp.]